MTGNIVLEVVIGLVFIFLLYSILATIIQEFLATFFSFRAKTLAFAIYRMLVDDNNNFKTAGSRFFSLFKRTRKPNLKSGQIVRADQLFYHHPLIKFLAEGKNRSKPAYIKNSTFSKIIIDLLQGDQAKPGINTSLAINTALKDKTMKWNGHSATIENETLLFLKSLWTDSKADGDKFKEILEDWFDETMERASGWYKKYTQIILFFIGLIIAISFNVDTLSIVKKLEKDPKLREQLLVQTQSFINSNPDLNKYLNGDTSGSADSTAVRRTYELYNRADSLIKTDINKSNDILGLGYTKHMWRECPRKCCFEKLRCIGKSILGWIITALAITLGAPFWFDVLNKMMMFRGSVSTPSEKRSSKLSDKEENNKPAVG